MDEQRVLDVKAKYDKLGEEVRKVRAERLEMKREYHRLLGLCLRCGKEGKELNSRGLCESCEKWRVAHNKASNKSQQRKREAHKILKLCAICDQPVWTNEKGHELRLCKKHAKLSRFYQKTFHERHDR